MAQFLTQPKANTHHDTADQLHADLMLAPLDSNGEPDFEAATLETLTWAPDPIAPADEARLAYLVDDLNVVRPKSDGIAANTRMLMWFAHGAPRFRQLDGPARCFEQARDVIQRRLDGRPDRDRTPPPAANDNAPPAGAYPGITSSGYLVAGFVPPDYHIDGVIQSGFLYSVTAVTGSGKTAILLLTTALTALGAPLGNRDVKQGRVVYFAGENPDDVTMRWIAMAESMGFDPDDMDVHFITGTFNIAQTFRRIEHDVRALGGADLVVIDTSAAYFQGQDENSNTELGRHARGMRALTTLPGEPCVLVACHPTKNADQFNLLPRGGGAFLAEVDGNLAVTKSPDGTIKLHHQGKHRGPDFTAISFELKTVTAEALKDSRGRDVPTVIAAALDAGEVAGRAKIARRDEDSVLLEIERDGGQSLSAMAESCGWYDRNGEPDKGRTRRATDKLKRDKLATYSGRRWKLTNAGHDALADVRAERHHEQHADRIAARLVGDRAD